jgi:hypothetical protein
MAAAASCVHWVTMSHVGDLKQMTQLSQVITALHNLTVLQMIHSQGHNTMSQHHTIRLPFILLAVSARPL